MNFDEQIQMIKHWIDEQSYSENFIIKDQGDNGYQLLVVLDNGDHAMEYPIFDSDMLDSALLKGDVDMFLVDLRTCVERSLRRTKADIELYIEDL